MIRIGPPSGSIEHVRARAVLASKCISFGAVKARRTVITTIRHDLDVIARIAVQMSPKVLSAARSASARRLRIEAFDERFQLHVDLLCEAAKYGPAAGDAVRYDAQRAWFLDHYEPIRTEVLAYLEDHEEDDLSTPCLLVPRDAFEALFLPIDLDSVIHSSYALSRIMRTRAALDFCMANLNCGRDRFSLHA